MTEKDATQIIIATGLRENPEILTVLEIAGRARLAESATLPVSPVGSADFRPISTPEHQGSQVTPPATQRAWF